MESMFLVGGVIDKFVMTISVFMVLTIGMRLIMKYLKQPLIISYILVGIFLGEHGLGFVEDAVTVTHLGEIGIVILLFFIGMEISLPEFVRQWKVALIGTLLQVTLSVVIMSVLGMWLGWNTVQSILVGFVIALSSSAVIIKLLAESGLMGSKVGRNVLSILLTKDMIIVPLLIITSFLGGEAAPVGEIILMILGGVLMLGGLAYLYSKQSVRLPFSNFIQARS